MLPDHDIINLRVLPDHDIINLHVLPDHDIINLNVLPGHDIINLRVLPDHDIVHFLLEPPDHAFEVSLVGYKRRVGDAQLTEKNIFVFLKNFFENLLSISKEP